MSEHSIGVPGNPGIEGREKGASGKIIPGGKSQKGSNGVNFFSGSAQNNPDPRKGIGVAAPHSIPSLNAPPHPIGSGSSKDKIKVPKVGN